MRAAGYTHVQDRAGFDALSRGCGKVFVESDVGYSIAGRAAIPLSDRVAKGIELLDNEAGFFMMIEGGRTDWCGHANDLTSSIYETLSFNEAVETAYAFYEKHPDETLIIVTGDHECGGLEIHQEKLLPQMPHMLDAQQFQSAHYAKSFEQWKKSGLVTPDVAADRLIMQFGLMDMTDEEMERLQFLAEAALASNKKDKRAVEIKTMYGRGNPAVVYCLHQVAERAGTKWTSFSHTAAPVITTAVGIGAQQFSGKRDNAETGMMICRLINPAA